MVSFWFCEFLYGIYTLKCHSYVSVLECVCDFPYSWAVVCEGSPLFVIVISVGFFALNLQA